MTSDQDKLLRNVALLVCSLADTKAGSMACSISNDSCDGPNSHRYREGRVDEQKKSLTKYRALISETRELARS